MIPRRASHSMASGAFSTNDAAIADCFFLPAFQGFLIEQLFAVLNTFTRWKRVSAAFIPAV
jgi:hypothetical protein